MKVRYLIDEDMVQAHNRATGIYTIIPLWIRAYMTADIPAAIAEAKLTPGVWQTVAETSA